MTRATLALCAVITLQAATTTPLSRAEAFLNLLAKPDFAAAVGMFDDAMLAAMPELKLPFQPSSSSTDPAPTIATSRWGPTNRSGISRRASPLAALPYCAMTSAPKCMAPEWAP